MDTNCYSRVDEFLKLIVKLNPSLINKELKMKKISLIIALFTVTIGITACGGNSQKVEEHKSGRLISATLMKTFSSSAVNLQGVDTKYPVKVYRVVYETKNSHDDFIKVSGLLSVPQKGAQEKSPTLLFHHGTVYNNKYAPTEYIVKDSSPVLPAYIGYIVAAPDYIGYGESSNELHPYLNAKLTASTSIDLLRAIKTVLKDKNISSNNQLFLGGYSEGGSATMASQKMLETELSDEFTVTASSAGAGGYTLSKVLLEDAQKILDNYDNFIIRRPHNMGFIFKAMDAVYDLKMLDAIFQSEYVSVVDTIYDGSHNSDYIDSKLSIRARELLKKDFLERLVNGQEVALLNAFKANDLFNWNPKAPTQLFHGRDDDWVVFSHAQVAYDQMKSNGATDLELVECSVRNNQATNHANCFVPYLFSSYEFFSKYAKDL